MLPWKMPELIIGRETIHRIPDLLNKDNVDSVLVVTTTGFIKRGSLNKLFEELDKKNINCEIYCDVTPDPTFECIEKGVNAYISANCKGIIAVGGGSVMDCAKIIGARVSNTNKSIKKMVGLLKVRTKLPPLYAVPTTAGTGSEVTVAAVVTDEKNNYKYAISDPCLLPKYAILSPELTFNLPQKLTAFSGMDALTHAIEAYTNKFSSKESKEYARKATKMIFEYLPKAYEDGENYEAREKMLEASYYAGAAFTKAYVGYVHAIAHAIGGLYHIQHGMANAVILPVVLEEYGSAIYKQLSEIADVIGINGANEKEKAEEFINKIKEMSSKLSIPTKFDEIESKDTEEIVKRVLKEANPGYPVPVIWNSDNVKNVLKKISTM